MYKFWTVQHKKVLEIIKEKGVYKADLSSSRFVGENPALYGLYKYIIDSFNNVNGFDVDGVIFAFLYCDNNRIYPFNDFNDFSHYIRTKKQAIETLWKKYSNDDYVVLELIYESNFNPLFIDINDFQLLMPPLVVLPPYTQESFGKILNNLSLGRTALSEFPSYLIQAHLPYITEDNVVNVYPIFSLT